MIKIGEFAKLGCVSVKTLRHYDRLKLLQPAWVDVYSGYRYYELPQLMRLNEILLFKLMGFSLENISFLLEHRSAEQIQELMRSQEKNLREQQQEVTERLHWLRSSQQQLMAKADAPLKAKVLMKRQPAMRLMVVQQMLVLENRAALRKVLAQMQMTLMQNLKHELGPAALPYWVVCYGEIQDEESDLQTVEVGVPVEGSKGKPLPNGLKPPLRLRDLPARETVLTLLYDPDRYQSEEARLAMFDWAQRSAYRFEGSFMELHYEDEQKHLIELQREVQPSLPPQILSTQRRKQTMSDAKIVRKTAQLYIGKTRSFTMNTTDEISAFWTAFFENWKTVQELLIAPGSEGFHSLGICYPMVEGEAFDYMVAFPLKGNKLVTVPDGFEVTMLPEQDYVVVAAPGPKDSIQKAYAYIFETWLPQQTEWEHDRNQPDFEYYPPEFNDFKDDSVLYIYVPIRKKN